MRRNSAANKYKNGTIFSIGNYQCAIGNDNCSLIIAELPINCDYGFRNYDKKQRRFTSVDPLTAKYPELTPFQFASNTPIQAIDLDGLEMFLKQYPIYLKKGLISVVNAPSYVYVHGRKIQAGYIVSINYTSQNGDVVQTSFNSYGAKQDEIQKPWYIAMFEVYKDGRLTTNVNAGLFMKRLTQVKDKKMEIGDKYNWSVINHLAHKMCLNGNLSLEEEPYDYQNSFIHLIGQTLASAVYGKIAARLVADIHERRGRYFEKIASGQLDGVPQRDIEDTYRDLINNEIGRNLGTVIREKYGIDSETKWAPTLLSNVLNDIQSYVKTNYPSMNFKPFTPKDEFIQNVANFLNKYVMSEKKD